MRLMRGDNLQEITWVETRSTRWVLGDRCEPDFGFSNLPS